MSDPILRRMHACVLAEVPVVLWGPPGIGKTARVKEYAHTRNLYPARWLLSRCEPIDLKPRIYSDGKIIIADPPEIDKLLEIASKTIGVTTGVMFLDELNRASRETESAALDIIDSPPQGIAVIVACNPPCKGQSARSLDAATANRFCHLDVKADSMAWVTAQLSGWQSSETDFPVPAYEDMDRALQQARVLFSGFVRTQPTALDAMPTDTVKAGLAWASPRSWDNAIRVYAAGKALGYDVEDLVALIAGCVGSGLATEAIQYITELDLPDPEVVLESPKAYKPPADRVDKTIAAITAVVAAVDRNFTDARWKAAWTVINVCTDAGQADAGAVGSQMLSVVWKKIATRPGGTKGYTDPARLMGVRLAEMVTGKKRTHEKAKA